MIGRHTRTEIGSRQAFDMDSWQSIHNHHSKGAEIKGQYVLDVERTGPGSMEAVGSQGLPLPALGPRRSGLLRTARVTGLNVIEARAGCGQAATDAGRSKLGNTSGLRKAMISSISPLRSVRTLRESGMKAPACSAQR